MNGNSGVGQEVSSLGKTLAGSPPLSVSPPLSGVISHVLLTILECSQLLKWPEYMPSKDKAVSE